MRLVEHRPWWDRVGTLAATAQRKTANASTKIFAIMAKSFLGERMRLGQGKRERGGDCGVCGSTRFKEKRSEGNGKDDGRNL
jgi:hypothetical protein